MNEPALKHDDEIESLIAQHGGDFPAAIDDKTCKRHSLGA